MKSLKFLNGSELAGFIQERQSHQVRALRQSKRVIPKLAIVVMGKNPVIDIYIRLKQRYGSTIGVEVEIHRIDQTEATPLINKLNVDPSVHGVIIQLPLDDPAETDTLVNLVSPGKDVDALGKKSTFDPATPMAILWLLAGYNIDLRGKQIVLIGHGKLVGAPLERLLNASNLSVTVVDRSTHDMQAVCLEADVIVTATGQPGILTSYMVKPNAVVVDAGVASEGGKTVGDVAQDLYDRDDISITPKKGGVGPLTVCALFENVLLAAGNSVATKLE